MVCKSQWKQGLGRVFPGCGITPKYSEGFSEKRLRDTGFDCYSPKFGHQWGLGMKSIFGIARRKKFRMRDSREKGAEMRDEEPLFQTLWKMIWSIIRFWETTHLPLP